MKEGGRISHFALGEYVAELNVRMSGQIKHKQNNNIDLFFLGLKKTLFMQHLNHTMSDFSTVSWTLYKVWLYIAKGLRL